MLYLRFLFLYFIIKYLIKEKIINFKYLFFSFCLCALFVASDIIVQFFFDKDIFGFEKLNSSRRLAGPFGDEAIAGSFIQRFFIFIPFLVLFFLNIKKNLKIIFIILSIIICMLGIIFAGNRVPLFLFCILMILFIFYGKFFQKTLLISLICSISFITIIAKKNENFYNHYYGFLSKSNEIIEYATTRFFTDQKIILSNTYIKEFETGILTWEQNKFFGGGIKSFYYNCSNIKNSAMDEFGGTNCNTHPHNYYLEIASELGIIGLILILTVFLTVFLKAVKILHFSKNLILNSKVIIPFFLVFIVEIFPFKTTGSFFTTTNSTFLFIILSFIVGLSELKNLSKNKNE